MCNVLTVTWQLLLLNPLLLFALLCNVIELLSHVDTWHYCYALGMFFLSISFCFFDKHEFVLFLFYQIGTYMVLFVSSFKHSGTQEFWFFLFCFGWIVVLAADDFFLLFTNQGSAYCPGYMHRVEQSLHLFFFIALKCFQKHYTMICSNSINSMVETKYFF